MAYVDLNPIRAGIAPLPEESDFTSIQARIRELNEAQEAEVPPTIEADTPVALLGFQDQVPASQPAIPFQFPEYLQLVDWSSRVVHPDKRGAVDSKIPPILQRLHIDRDAWQKLLRPGANRFGRAIRTLDRLAQFAKTSGNSICAGSGMRRYSTVLDELLRREFLEESGRSRAHRLDAPDHSPVSSAALPDS